MNDEDADDDAADLIRQLLAAQDFQGRELTATQATIVQLARKLGVRLDSDLPAPQSSSDQLWLCRSCGTKLGVYAPPPEDVLRVRYKDLFLYIRVGETGYVEVFCRTCGSQNRSGYVPPPSST